MVLRYRLRPDPFPLAFQQARATLKAMWNSRLVPDADPQRIGVVGSSAGGLLAGLLATGVVLSIEPSRPPPPRPAFHVQSYGLAEEGVPLELHVYPEGWHGLGLADGVAWGAHGHLAVPHTAQWSSACARWLRMVTRRRIHKEDGV